MLNVGTSVTDCYVSGEMTANENYQGGVFGENEFDMTPTYSANRIVSNMRMRATMGGDYSRGGFIGFLMSTGSSWLRDSIAIGESGAENNAGSTQAVYRFAGNRYNGVWDYA